MKCYVAGAAAYVLMLSSSPHCLFPLLLLLLLLLLPLLLLLLPLLLLALAKWPARLP